MAELTIIDTKNWADLEKRFSWVREMSHVSQHKIHHAEGNVAIHTQMVIKGLSQVEGYGDLNAMQKEILWTAALLHDVEKRSTSVDYGHGIISARGHAEKGEFTAREVLYKEVPTPLDIREQVASLVRLHGLPLWFRENPDPDLSIRAASLRVDTRMLAILSESDARGRICEDPRELIEAIQAFKQRCKDLDCWGKPAAFTDGNQRFRYFHPELSLPGNESSTVDKTLNNVFLLVSLPYADRASYITQHLVNLPIINLQTSISVTDNLQTEQIEKEADKYLDKRQSFVCNGSNLTQAERFPLISNWSEKGYTINIIYIEQAYSIWIQRVKQINSDLTDADIDKFLLHLEMPQLTDAHHVEYIVL